MERILQPHQERVVQEAKELTNKIDALEAFIFNSPTYKGLYDIDQDLMYKQLDAMKAYEHILVQRIARF